MPTPKAAAMPTYRLGKAGTAATPGVDDGIRPHDSLLGKQIVP